MKVQLKPEAPDRVEVGLGPRFYLFERGKEVDVLSQDWPALERDGYFEPVPEKPVKEAKKDEKK